MTDSRYYKRTIVKDHLYSQFLQEDRHVKIVLPPGYNELLTYPVVYCQDGDDFLNYGRIATQMTQMVLDEGLEPFIIVAVEVDKTVRTAQYSPTGAQFAAYVRFFGEELVPYIESRYPIRPDNQQRVIAGDSLGGTVSLHIALQYRHLFTRVLSLSGAFLESTRDVLSVETDLSWLHLFMVVGLQEEAVETQNGTFNFVREHRLTEEMLAARLVRLHSAEKDGRHVWGFWQKELPEALRLFFPGNM